MPILMGKKNALLDWSQFNARARAALGYVPTRGKPLNARELKAMGFTEAAKVARG